MVSSKDIDLMKDGRVARGAAVLPVDLSVDLSVDLLFIATSGVTADRFIVDQVAWYRSEGLRCGICSADDHDIATTCRKRSIPFFPIPFSRQPDLVRDFKSIFLFAALLRRLTPRMVVYGTPKASLICSLVSILMRVPVRIYHLRGLRLETSTGIGRLLLHSFEKVTATTSTLVIVNSESLRNVYVDMKLVDLQKTVLLGAGSSNGVDVNHFLPASSTERATARKMFGLEDDVFVLGFVGRMSADKGLNDLCKLFDSLAEKKIRLLMVGPDEGFVTRFKLQSSARADEKTHFVPFMNDTRMAYWAMDLLVFPSFREGLPNVVLEAAACGIPCMARIATGTVDTIVNERTGWLLSSADWENGHALVEALMSDPRRLRRAGKNARSKATSDFSQATVWRNFRNFFSEQLSRT